LTNGPAFAKSHVKSFVSSLKLLAATTDKAPALKQALSTVMRGVERAIESAGGHSATVMALGGYPETHPLGDTYYSQTPLLYGEYMAKVCLVPVSQSLRTLVNSPIDLKGRPQGLRDAMIDFFLTQSAEWELRVQFCVDPELMPIEDSSKIWPEDKSPYLAVARITMLPQPAWNKERAAAIDDGMSFSPWHALAMHRPLGSVMRVRKTVYQATARLRAERNGVTLREPRRLGDVKI
jgi:hypothetical protein